MNRILPVAFLSSILLLACPGLVRADIALGADEYVNNAFRVELVRVFGIGERAGFLPPVGVRQVWVEEVLKGVDTAQEILVPAGTLQPEEKAVVLFQYDSEQDGKNPNPKMLVWPVDGATGLVNIGDIPAESTGGKRGGLPRVDTLIPLQQVRNAIATGSPEEVGLSAQVIDALLFPAKHQQLAARDSRRATYVRFVLALRDLARDIPALALLLESPDKATRDAAAARLMALGGQKVTVDPRDAQTADSRWGWSQAWSLTTLPAKHPAWPPVPADAKMPKDAFPSALLQAVRDGDADAFAKAFPEWLDSGVMRDRQIEYATNTLRGEAEGNPFFQPDGKPHPKRPGWPEENLVEQFYARGYLVPARRLPMDLAVNPKVPAEQRLKYMAMLASFPHPGARIVFPSHKVDLAHNADLIARDQAARLAFIQAARPGSEEIRRAAFWEVGPEYTVTARSVALQKLASLPDKNPQQLLMTIYLAGNDGRSAPSSEALSAARASIEAGNKEFIDALLEYMRTHEDPPAGWGGRLMCQQGQTAAIPIMRQWLKSKNPEIRSAGALNLCWIPRRESVPALLEAIRAEPPAAPQPAGEELAQHPNINGEFVEPRQQMIVALAQTDDPRGLDTLIAALQEPCREYVRREIVRGLGRIRDKRALPALAHLAGTATDFGLQAEIVNAFDCIQHDPRGIGPYTFGVGGGVIEQDVRNGLERIKRWQTEATPSSPPGVR